LETETSNIEWKAVLKHAQSKRFAITGVFPNFAKRLECARFTAAFPHDKPYGQTALAALICPNTTRKAGTGRKRSKQCNETSLYAHKRFQAPGDSVYCYVLFG
jgi:hypothetical protein